MEARIVSRTEAIRAALRQMASRMKQGDDSEIVSWVSPERLACGQRPSRHHPLYGASGKNIERAAGPLVMEWAERIRLLGVRSIISLMHARDLSYYEGLDLGAPTLLDFYRTQGFDLEHLPWEDPHHSKTSPAQVRKTLVSIRGKALEAYGRLTKPVLIQCSAGIDRTAPVAAYIAVASGRSLRGYAAGLDGCNDGIPVWRRRKHRGTR